MMPKFRAWFKPLKRMYLVRELKFERNGNIRVITDKTGGMAPINFELMQFIGLFDKNKKEICEGDILKYQLFGGKTLWKEIGEVDFINGSFLVNGLNMQEVVYRRNAEIIGNKFEHPKLIKELK